MEDLLTIFFKLNIVLRIALFRIVYLRSNKLPLKKIGSRKMRLHDFTFLKHNLATAICAICLSVWSQNSFGFFYQINSESLNNPAIEVFQTDLKLLAGFESEESHIFDLFRQNRVALGGYSLYQSANDPSYFQRAGGVLQIRSQAFFPGFYLQYEHHDYKWKNSISEAAGTTPSNWFSENRYGAFYARYDEPAPKYILDTYAETFLIPEVNKTALLSVVRATLAYQYFEVPFHPLAEIYFKDSPANFGGKIQDLRIGAQWRPFEFASLKILTNLLPASETTTHGILFQFNIFKEGVL